MALNKEQFGGLVCVPNAISKADRAAHFALAAELFTKLAQERADLENGYGFRFGPDALESVVRFIGNERKCCPFLTFDLTISPESGPLWLRMTGPEGTRAVLDAELNLVNACGCEK